MHPQGVARIYQGVCAQAHVLWSFERSANRYSVLVLAVILLKIKNFLGRFLIGLVLGLQVPKISVLPMLTLSLGAQIEFSWGQSFSFSQTCPHPITSFHSVLHVILLATGFFFKKNFWSVVENAWALAWVNAMLSGFAWPVCCYFFALAFCFSVSKCCHRTVTFFAMCFYSFWIFVNKISESNILSFFFCVLTGVWMRGLGAVCAFFSCPLLGHFVCKWCLGVLLFPLRCFLCFQYFFNIIV